jgi:hypothetical protein
MIIKKLIPFFVLIFLFEKISAQSFQEQMKAMDEAFKKNKAEKLLIVNRYPNPDLNRAKALDELVCNTNASFLKHFKELLPYAEECLVLSKKLHFDAGSAAVFFFLANLKKRSRDRQNSFLYLDSCINICEGKSDPALRRELSLAYKLMGRFYQESEDYYLALKFYFKSLEHSDFISKENKSSTLFNIGLLYYKQKNYEKGDYYIKKNIDGKIVNPQDITLIDDYKLIAAASIEQKSFDKAEVYIKKIGQFNLKETDYTFSIFYDLKGDFFEAKDIYDSAYYYKLKQYNFIANEKNSEAENMIAMKISLISLKLNKIEQAKEYAQKCLTSTTNNKTLKFNGNYVLSEYYNRINDKLNAHKYLIESNKYRDSIYLETTYNQNNALANIYEITKLENTTLASKNELIKKQDAFNLQKALDDAALNRQLFLNNQQEQSLLLQNNQLLLSREKLNTLNKDKELQHLAFLKTQADLQTEQLQNSEKEKELTLVQKETILKSTQVKSLSQENELNKLKQRQLLIYGIAGLTTLLFAGLYLFNRNRAKQAQLKVELEKKEAEFQRSLADVSMSALRSQMNPHFIFNCLNSIKLYTTQNDTVAASNYLTKFSKLIRMALENSRSETVTLDAELESLELYIQMEAMRFKEKLKYSIAIDKNVDSSFIEIPPMLLQPYVENAIWHGLMHREDGGRIDISVRVVPNEHTLAITIKDNGVGREKAAQLKSKTATAHKSFGTKVTGERLNLINQIYKTGASVTIEDLTSNGEVTGTLVTIKIPFE